ncbi:hypothetical protein [Moorena bouillonii]|uniref:hypothetical protein n=1 Tax=Moorena bouillonii TaxID=207920 RepID=UPI001BE0EA14|nr:hypothetical protein [Moorena bouillonii]
MATRVDGTQNWSGNSSSHQSTTGVIGSYTYSRTLLAMDATLLLLSEILIG